MKPVTFSSIKESDFHSADTIKIEFSKHTIEKFNGWVLYVYHGLCAFLGLTLLFALWNITTINPERFYWLLGANVLAFGIASLLWVGRR
jgi:hypothetical protein